MKFYKGQQVVCISQKSEWDYVVPNFNEQLKIALGVKNIPKQNETYTINNPMELHYKGKCYVKLDGFEHNIFAETAFKPLDENDSKEYGQQKARAAMFASNN